MDWLRRNWPDLLIGLALIAVIAGIVATLLTGGSFFPIGSGDDAPTATTPPPVTSTPTPTPADPTGSDASQDDGADDGGSDGLDAPSVAVLPPSDPGPNGAEVASDAAQDALAAPPGAPDPSVGDDDATSSSPAAPSSSSDDGGQASAPGDSDATSSLAAPATPSSPAPAAPAPVASDLPTDPYRVSVGAFGLRENAEAQAQRFRADGYPVFLGVQGDLTLVLVGPYVEEAEARRVADRIRAGDYDVDPIIYRYEPDDGEASPTPAAEASPEPTLTPETPVAASTPTAGSDSVRLQVGAYGDREGAAPQIERLTSLGFDVAAIDEGGLVKLVIGPFSGQALEDARIILDGAGIESFAR